MPPPGAGPSGRTAGEQGGGKGRLNFLYSRDFVRSCQTPILVLPDDVPGHPYAVAMETVRLAPNAEATVYPWKEPKELRAKTVQQVHDFLRAHKPATATH